MKRIGLFIAAAAAAAALSGLFSGVDVGKLQPVRVIYLQKDGGNCLVSTDTGERGTGGDLKAAMAALRKTASGEVFLDTADYLLLDAGCMEMLADAYGLLRPGTEICLTAGTVDLEAAGQFLSVHQPKTSLAQCAAGRTEIPILKIREGRMELIGLID